MMSGRMPWPDHDYSVWVEGAGSKAEVIQFENAPGIDAGSCVNLDGARKKCPFSPPDIYHGGHEILHTAA